MLKFTQTGCSEACGLSLRKLIVVENEYLWFLCIWCGILHHTAKLLQYWHQRPHDCCHLLTTECQIRLRIWLRMLHNPYRLQWATRCALCKFLLTQGGFRLPPMVPGSAWVRTANGMSLGSVVLAQTDRHRPRYICNNRPHLMLCIVMQRICVQSQQVVFVYHCLVVCQNVSLCFVQVCARHISCWTWSIIT